MSASEVTVEQYEGYASVDEMRRKGAGDRFPVSFVTWAEAAGYCNWVSDQEKIPPAERAYPNLDKSGKHAAALPPDFDRRLGFRLPTEQEWEFIARAGALTSRFFGTCENDLANYAWYVINSRGKGPVPVGQFRPNPLGFFDVYGNVDEWCEIWPASTQDPDVKAARGGTYRGTPKYMRSAMPHPQGMDDKFSTRGFRIAITLDAP